MNQSGQSWREWAGAAKCPIGSLDPKSVGSVIEMLVIGVLEVHILAEIGALRLRLNPAHGVDLPDLGLGIKSPSKNHYTSEPFLSAYQRLYGSEYDNLVLLTDYQTAKKRTPFRLQIIEWKYVTKSQLADAKLCRIARKHRESLLETEGGEPDAKRMFKFLAYVNQRDWLGARLLSLVDALDDPSAVRKLIERAEASFARTNVAREKKSEVLIPYTSIQALRAILSASPLLVAILHAAENWVVDRLNDTARGPSPNEWERLRTGPLDGGITMSFALQWRYNFGGLFPAPKRPRPPKKKTALVTDRDRPRPLRVSRQRPTSDM